MGKQTRWQAHSKVSISAHFLSVFINFQIEKTNYNCFNCTDNNSNNYLEKQKYINTHKWKQKKMWHFWVIYIKQQLFYPRLLSYYYINAFLISFTFMGEIVAQKWEQLKVN